MIKERIKFGLQYFAEANTNKTTSASLSDEMKTFYSDYLIDNAEPKLVHDQFGQKQNIPKHGGKVIEFRKFSPLGKALTALSEGVTPDGQTLTMSVVNGTVRQYGGYVELSDMLLLTAIDNNLVMATKLLGSQAGRTLDTITREVLAGGTNVQYAEEAVDARYKLVGGEASGNHYLTVDAVRRAVRSLKNQNADTINGAYVGIIHPDCAYDLMSDEKWVNVKTYSDPKGIYEGEIGKIENVRFVESTEAKIFHAENLFGSTRNLSVTGYNSATKVVTVSEELATDNAVKGRFVIIDGVQYEITASTAYVPVSGETPAVSATFTVKEAPASNYPASGDTVYPGEAGAKGRDVYATLILGENAYGTTSIKGGGLTHIIKQLGSAGTSDPLNQRATVGWKASKTAVRLVENFMRRIETASTFQAGAN